jgi:hypothetical protein
LDLIYFRVAKRLQIDPLRLESEYPVSEVIRLYATNMADILESGGA